MVVTITPAIANTLADLAQTNTLGLIAICLLLALLILKEILGSSSGARAKDFGQSLNVALVPLLFSFALAALARVAGLIR